MAERRMFSKSIIDSDAFLDMPSTTQLLYFHLSMRADDEGFVGSPKRIMRTIGATDDDMRILIAKRFILAFNSGVIVIKHWKIHNYIQSDRFKPTTYQEEREQLKVKDNRAYTELDKESLKLLENTECIQNVHNLDAQNRLGKIRLDKTRLDKSRLGGYGGEGDKPLPPPVKKTSRFIPPDVTEVKAYIMEKGYAVDAEAFCDFYESKGWLVGKAKMKDWRAAVRTWERNRPKGNLDVISDWLKGD